MHTLVRVFFCILVFLSVHFTVKAQSPKYEVRAVWLTTIGGIDWPHSYQAESQKKELVKTLDQLQQAGINTVLLQTRVRATTVFPSALEPWDGCITGTPGKQPSYDPLQLCIEECHKRSMECHAWVVTIPVGKWNGLGCRQLRQKYPKLIKRIGEEGYMDPSVSYLDNSGLLDEGIRRVIEEGDYAIALCSGSEDELFLNDDACIKRIPGVLSSRINASIGIMNSVEDIDSVVDFLGLLYGLGKYGNILIYGAENESYQVVDGIAYNLDGTDLFDQYLAKLGFNLFINLLPVSGEEFPKNRQEAYFAFYESLSASPFIGFEPDTEQMGSISADLEQFMGSLSGCSVEEAFATAEDRLLADGMEEYLEDVRKQWEEYN